MSEGARFVARFVWTAGGFLASAAIRFGGNVALAYLLAPDILGVVLVVNAVRLGIELLTDVGIEQNIVHHRDGLDRRFRDTAWSLQVLRGALLSAVFLLAAPLLAHAYEIDVRIFLVAAASPLLGGLHSTAIFVLVKRLEVRRRNLFELACEGLALVVQVLLALWLRSVWAPVFGLLAAVAIRSALSYTLPAARQRFRFDTEVATRIVAFGKWIALTSLVMYAANNLDRLYLGTVAPFAALGVYGIARAIGELPTTLARRMSYQIVFPALAGSTGDDLRVRMASMARIRLLVALALCAGLSLGATAADLLIGLVYDPRYAAAGWMLAVLLLGAPFAVLSNLNEALLLSAGKPLYSSLANLARLATHALVLPLGYQMSGFPGAVIAAALTEALHYVYIGVGLHRVRLTLWRQDAAALGTALGVFLIALALRAQLDLGGPFQGMWDQAA